jgi:hypothetical protein
LTSKIFLVVPKLIEQPTWGGRYILKFKNWSEKKLFKNIKIGQSYELFSGIKLRGDIDSSLDSSFTGELGYAMEPDKVFYEGDKSKLIHVSQLINKDPEGVLGKRVIEEHGSQIKILIKLTQAKGNSFQLHVKEKDSSKKWRSKPESFYYFEPGLLTLGVKRGIDWKEYKASCMKIQQGMESLSKLVRSKRMSLSQAKKKAKELIEKYNLWQFVNLVKSSKDDLVHISGGLHHSWEEDEKKYPLGNVLYEHDFDVMDPVSTVRCFDKGKIKPDGSLRKIDIDDYFKYIERTEKTNEPKNHFAKPKVLLDEKGTKVESLLRTKHYSLDKTSTTSEYSGEFTQLKDSFHHLFVKAGKAEIRYNGKRLELTRGHSCFIPASIEQYRIISKSKKETQVLKTFVS